MNKWKAFIEGQVVRHPKSSAVRHTSASSGRSRCWTKYDQRAKKKRIAKRRAKKGYK